LYFRVRLCALQTISNKEQFLSTLCVICLEIIDRYVYANISLIYVLRPAKQIQVPLVDRDLVREFSPRGKQVYGARVWVLISRRKLTGLGWLTGRGGTWELRPHVNHRGLLNPLGRVLAKIAAIRLEEMRATRIIWINKHNSINWSAIKFDALKHVIKVSKQIE